MTSKPTPSPHHPILVLGGGVLGLSTALRLLQHGFRNVTVVSGQFSPDTTSDIAGALIRPDYLGDTDKEKVYRWTAASFQELWKVMREETGEAVGINLVSNYEVFPQQKEEPFWKDIVFGFRQVTGPELQLSPTSAGGWFYTTFIVEGNKYLPYLERRLQSLGGKIIRRKLRSEEDIASLAGPGDSIIINCTGLFGFFAQERGIPILADPELKPVRGQILLVEAPSIKVAYGDYSHPKFPVYIYPRKDCVLLGGTYQPGQTDTTPNPHHTHEILSRCSAFFPELSRCRILDVRAGLRPGRRSVRLEAEKISTQKSALLGGKYLIHCTGHGGAGWTVSWGCAGDVVDMVVAYLTPGERGASGYSKL